jgi:paxillin
MSLQVAKAGGQPGFLHLQSEINPECMDPDAFGCFVCGKNLVRENYLTKEGKAYCEKDYEKLFLPNCNGCHEKILEGQYIAAYENCYHEEHFVCFQCRAAFSDGEFYNHNGNPCCEKCYKNKGTNCEDCGKMITDAMVTVNDKVMHKDCFKCQSCDTPFDDLVYVTYENRIYHKECFKEQFCFVCTVCSERCDDEYYVIDEKKNKVVHSECLNIYEDSNMKKSNGLLTVPSTARAYDPRKKSFEEEKHDPWRRDTSDYLEGTTDRFPSDFSLQKYNSIVTKRDFLVGTRSVPKMQSSCLINEDDSNRDVAKLPRTMNIIPLLTRQSTQNKIPTLESPPKLR